MVTKITYIFAFDSRKQGDVVLKMGGGVGGKGSCGLTNMKTLFCRAVLLGHPLTMHIPVYPIILFAYPHTDQPAR